MDFKRREGESERAYYSRVAQELKYGARKEVDALLDYKAGRLSIRGLEEALVGLFAGKSEPAPAPEPAVEAASDPAPVAPEAASVAGSEEAPASE